MMALYEKTVKGTLFGDANPTTDIPKLLGLYRSGALKLDELITRTYSLEDVNQGYQDLEAGLDIRGVIVHRRSVRTHLLELRSDRACCKRAISAIFPVVPPGRP